MRTMPLAALTAALLASGILVSATAAGGRTASSEALIKVAFNKTLKKTILVDARGFTIYLFTADTGGTSTCSAQLDPQCPKFWHPVLTTGTPVAGKGIARSLLDTTKRTDGKLQVRYNRHPLYYYHGGSGYPGDKKAGDVEGQGFANLWYVLSPKGTPIRTKVS